MVNNIKINKKLQFGLYLGMPLFISILMVVNIYDLRHICIIMMFLYTVVSLVSIFSIAFGKNFKYKVILFIIFIIYLTAKIIAFGLLYTYGLKSGKLINSNWFPTIFLILHLLYMTLQFIELYILSKLDSLDKENIYSQVNNIEMDIESMDKKLNKKDDLFNVNK